MSPWIEGCAGLCCDGLGGFKNYPGFFCLCSHLTCSASNRVIQYCILQGLSIRGVSEFSSCSTPPGGRIDPGSEQWFKYCENAHRLRFWAKYVTRAHSVAMHTSWDQSCLPILPTGPGKHMIYAPNVWFTKSETTHRLCTRTTTPGPGKALNPAGPH